ncbi:MAG: TonB family protein [Myxococcales bacterium]|nr:TonB family protein [Myxococcales bacterium]
MLLARVPVRVPTAITETAVDVRIEEPAPVAAAELAPEAETPPNVVQPVAAPRPPPRSPEPPSPTPPPAEETPVAFSNVTLTNEGKSSWAVAPSSGEEADGPVGPPGVPTGRRVEGVPGGVVGGTGSARISGLGDLKRRPSPPRGLDELLKRNYPRAARAQGIEGTARVRVRLDPDGKATILGTLSESYPGFGEACRQTLLDARRWEPGIGPDGKPTATEFPFSCRFEVE